MSEYSEVVEENDSYRVRIEIDHDASEPYNDGATPIFKLDNSRDYWGSYRAEAFNRQAESYVDTFNRLEDLGEKQVKIFERWLKVFHGNIKVQDWNLGNSREYGYLAFDTEEWREEVGAPVERLSEEDYLEEVRAWAEGDVWGVIVEKKFTTQTKYIDPVTEELVSVEDDEEWVELEDGACWGYYGRKWAEEAAQEALKEATEG